MQRLQGWVKYAAEALPVGKQQQAGGAKQEDEDDDAFIYGRVAVHSDDEEDRHHHHQQHTSSSAAVPQAGGASPDVAAAHNQQSGHRPLHYQHSYSESDLQELRNQAAQLQETPELIRLDSDDGTQQQQQQPGWAADWAAFDDLHPQRQQQQQQQGTDGASLQQQQQPQPSSTAGAAAAAAAAAAAGGTSSSTGSGGNGGSSSSRQQQRETPEELKFEAPSTTDCFETGEEVPDHDHTQERRELIIYAIPLTRGKTIFLPVCPWRTDPEVTPGWKKAVAGHVNKVQGEASEMWQKMANAEQGSAVHRLYKFGKRLLDSVPAEERLMRGVPKNVSKVIIHHPTQVSPETIMEQMQTMTKNYGIKAVGQAAAATVMLPLAIGVDLIILPGPQVLTYYTLWNMYRNTNGALGTTRMTKFVQQGGSSANIRVNYVAEPRLDKYYDAATDCPEGVLSEEDIEGMVADLREPDLLEALLSLRSKALREGNARTSRGGDEYTALPPMDPAASPSGFGAAGDDRKSSARW